MAKLAFSKLGLKVNNQVVNIHYNDQIIEVKQYISVNDKLKLISDVLNNSYDEQNNFANPVKTKVYIGLGIIEYYTNINFTDKQKEDMVKLYDCFESNGLLNTIINTIPASEYNWLVNSVNDTVKAFYAHRDSVLGILETIKTDYSDLNLDATEIQSKLADPQNMELLKNVLSKLG